ncbi:hypothetical protein pb186bvf_007578 [Paramecium bursaria]
MSQQFIIPPKHQDIVPDEDDVFDGDMYLEAIFKGPILTIDDYDADQPTLVQKVNREDEIMENIIFQIKNVKLTGDLQVRQRKARILKKNISLMMCQMKKTKEDNIKKAQHLNILMPAQRQHIYLQKQKLAQLKLTNDQVVNEARNNYEMKYLHLTELQMKFEILEKMLQDGKAKLNRRMKWHQKIIDKFNNIGYKVEDAGMIETEHKIQYKIRNTLLERKNQCEELQQQLEEYSEIIIKQKSQIDQVGKSLNQNYAKYVERLNFKENLTKQILEYRDRIVAEQSSVPIKKITVGYDWCGINSLVLILIFLVILFKQYY